MINATDEPIVSLTGSALDLAIREALDRTESILAAALQDCDIRTHLKQAFAHFLGPGNRKPIPFDAEFVRAAFLWQNTDARSTGSAPAMAAIARYVVRRTAAAHAFPYLKRGLRLVLVELWRTRALLLPSIFTPGPHFRVDVFEHEVLQWITSFDPMNSNGHRGTSTDTRRIRYYGPRLLWTTNWQSIEDISIRDIAELKLASLRANRGESVYRISGSPFPWTQLAAAAIEAFPHRVTFARADLAMFSAWTARQETLRGDFESFVASETVEPTAIQSDRSRSRPERPRSSRATRIAHASVTRVTQTKSLAMDDGAHSAGTHEAVATIFASIDHWSKSANWRKTPIPVYPGREHVDLSTIAPAWTETFNAWLHHRTNIKGYRSSADVLASLKILADYVFWYLPWWKELHPSGRVGVPAAPKHFQRFAYVTRTQVVPVDALPSTLLELIRKRRPNPDSAGVCIRHLYHYFKFVGLHYAEDDRIAGVGYRPPLDASFDVPRGRGRRNKSTKKVFPETIYAHLLFYAYAVERFGQHLLNLALEGKLRERELEMRTALRFKVEDFGLTLKLCYRGRELLIREIPNVFTWVERETEIDGERRTLVAPHLTALRLLTAAMETGHRLQTLQWLDRTTFDSRNTATESRYVFELFVNTDKLRPVPYATPMVFRVRDLLLREVEFQKTFTDFGLHPPVLYEGLAVTPFDPIRPLFRAPTSGRPILDRAYNDAWIALLVDFEAFYKATTGENHVELYYYRPLKTRDGRTVIHRTRGQNGAPFCTSSLLPTHTPHACRTTFVTNRHHQGHLELSDVSEAVGHMGLIATSHYNVPSPEQLAERLERSDIAMLGEYSMFETGQSSPYVHADRPDSVLRKSFERDRERTIKAFHFVAPVALWSMMDEVPEEHDGLELLKRGPMSQIRFRDTHICPVGEECPDDIVKLVGQPRRCGTCPISMRCVDHLPAISAKSHQLMERIQYGHTKRRRMEKAGEPISALDALWTELNLDTNELVGWQLSENQLQQAAKNAESAGESDVQFFVDEPEFVRRHLQCVTRHRTRAEFFLQRLAESNAFPSMASPQVEMTALVLRRKLLANHGQGILPSVGGNDDDIRAAATTLGMLMKSDDISLTDVTVLLSLQVEGRNEQLRLAS